MERSSAMDGEFSDMQSLIDNKVQEVVKANNQELLSSISDMINKISAKPSQTSILEIPKFKRKSNEEQYKINTKVLEQIERVNSALESSDMVRAKAAITEGNSKCKFLSISLVLDFCVHILRKGVK